jgi:hypothetical protein
VRRLTAIAALFAIVAALTWFVQLQVRQSLYDPGPRWSVTEVHPEFGRGTSADVTGARLRDGRLEVLVAMGTCSALSALDVTETTTTVQVDARDAGTGGDCTADVTPRFGVVTLDAPLAGRRLVDAKTGRDIEVDDCGRGEPPGPGTCGLHPGLS